MGLTVNDDKIKILIPASGIRRHAAAGKKLKVSDNELKIE